MRVQGCYSIEHQAISLSNDLSPQFNNDYHIQGKKKDSPTTTAMRIISCDMVAEYDHLSTSLEGDLQHVAGGGAYRQ